MTVDRDFIESLSKKQKQNVWSAQTVRLKQVHYKTTSETVRVDLCDILSKLHSRKVVSCQLKNRSLLVQNEKSKRTIIKCELSKSESHYMHYKVGDHLGVFASNRLELVEPILARLTNAPPPDQLVEVEKLKEKTITYSKIIFLSYSCF